MAKVAPGASGDKDPPLTLSDASAYAHSCPGNGAANFGQWFSFFGSICMWVSVALAGAGLAMPWWSRSIPSRGRFPTTSEASLWVAATTTYTDLTANAHHGCNGPCDQTRVGAVRLTTTCEQWDEVCSEARSACDSGAGSVPTPPPTRLDDDYSPSTTLFIGITTEPPGGGDGGFLSAATTWDPNGLVAPVMPEPPGFTLAPATSTEFPSSSTVTTVTSTTSTYGTTLTTAAPTAFIFTTLARLRPEDCPAKSVEEMRSAPYTAWEMAFELPLPVQNMIYASLSQAFYQIPPQYFALRPSQLGAVRLVWEVMVERSRPGRWLSEYSICPSSPAEVLHHWLHLREQRDVLVLVTQGMMPRDWTVDPMEDWAMKEAWENQAAGLLPTTEPPREVTRAQRVVVRTTMARETTTSPPPVITTTLNSDMQAPQPMSMSACHKSRYDRNADEEGAPWYMQVEACEVVTTCTQLVVLRAGIFSQMILGISYAAPAMIAFLGIGRIRDSFQLPPNLGLYLSALCFACLLIVVVLAGVIDTPEQLRGSGFTCTVVAMIFSIVSMVFAFISKILLTAPTDEQVIEDRMQREHPIVVAGGRGAADRRGAVEDPLSRIAWQGRDDPGAAFEAANSALRNQAYGGHSTPASIAGSMTLTPKAEAPRLKDAPLSFADSVANTNNAGASSARARAFADPDLSPVRTIKELKALGSRGFSDFDDNSPKRGTSFGGTEEPFSRLHSPAVSAKGRG